MPYNNVISRSDAQARVPESVSNALLRNLSNESAARALFTNVPVGSNQTRFPVLSALPIAYFVSGDTGLKQTTEVNWANKFLNIEEIACIVPIPEAALDDQSFDVWGEVQPLIEQAIGRTLDAAVFFGVNVPGTFPTNVVAGALAAGNVVARGTNNAAGGGIVGDIGDVVGLAEADGYDLRAGVAARALRGFARKARKSDGERFAEISIELDRVELDGVAFTFPMRGQWPTGVSAAEAVAFDPSEFVLGIRQDITYKILDQAVIQDNTGTIIYNLAQQDMVAMRCVFRAGWQVANTINYDQPTEASRYPAAVLRSPAA